MKGLGRVRWKPPTQKYSECCTCDQWSFKWGCMKPKRLGEGATIKFPCDKYPDDDKKEARV